MKLQEIIREIPNNDWLEITEQTSNYHKSYIGRAPKKYIVGEVLNYKAIDMGERKSSKGNYKIHRLLVKNNSICSID